MQQDSKKFVSVDLIILCLIAAASVYMFCSSISLSVESKLFPQIIAAVTFVFCIYAIGKNILTARAATPAQSQTPAVPKRLFHLVLIGIAVLYVLLLQPVGFLICTAALFLAIPLVLGNRNVKVLIPVAVLATVIFYLIFKKCFYVNLPSGILPFI